LSEKRKIKTFVGLTSLWSRESFELLIMDLDNLDVINAFTYCGSRM
jgi:hypothetical protein